LIFNGFFLLEALSLSSLAEDVLGGLLILGYQKSSPAQYILTQTANTRVGRLQIHRHPKVEQIG
jgi:hypothetical protein